MMCGSFWTRWPPARPAGVHLHTLRCPDRQAYERVLEQLRQAGFLYQ